MNKKTFVNEVFDDLKNDRFKAELLAEQNLKKARQESHEFKYFDDQLRQTMFECGQTEEIDLEKAKILIDEIKAKRLEALKKYGQNESFVTPQWSCKTCEDTGIVNGKRCTCFFKRLEEKLLKNSGLKNEILHSFADSDQQILDSNQMLQKAHNLAIAYTNKFPNVKTKNFVFMGDVGTGKTFLLECIANELLKKEFFVVYVTAFNLQNTTLKTLKLNPFEAEIILSPILECDLLIIDDLGSEPSFRNISEANLFSILNEREAKNKATLISTNLSLDDIEKRYGNRIFSRVFNQRSTKVIKFEGKDLRINAN